MQIGNAQRALNERFGKLFTFILLFIRINLLRQNGASLSSRCIIYAASHTHRRGIQIITANSTKILLIRQQFNCERSLIKIYYSRKIINILLQLLSHFVSSSEWTFFRVTCSHECELQCLSKRVFPPHEGSIYMRMYVIVIWGERQKEAEKVSENMTREMNFNW